MSRWADVVDFHRSLLADRVRMESYQRAISGMVRAGDVVLDLGTGTGILACMACKAGARRVYAIEAGDVVDLAKQVCLKNGLQDRVVFMNDLSSRVDLPERVDVLVTETLGNFGLDEGILGSIIDARERFLRENGTIIPRSVELFIAPVELHDVYQQKIDFWANDLYGLDFSPIRALATNHLYPVTLAQDAFLGDPVSLVRIDLYEAKASDVGGQVSFMANRRGTLHGMAGWFGAELTKETCLSNAPPITTSNWSHSFFPLERPVPLEVGDRLRVAINSLGNGAVWRWRVDVDAQSDSRGALRGQKAAFDQSTFWGFPLSGERLRRLSSRYAPKLSRRGEARLFLLNLFNGDRTIGEMEGELLRCHSDYFKSQREASEFVREVVASCA